MSLSLRARRERESAAYRKALAERTMMFANQRVLRDRDQGGICLMGSPGNGKTLLLLILLASILKHPSRSIRVMNMLLCDPMNDFFRGLLGLNLPFKIILTNPFDVRAWRWDIAADVRDPASATQFAENAIPDDSKHSSNKFYDTAPRIIFGAVLRELINRGVTDYTLRLAYLLTLETRYAEILLKTSNDPVVRHAGRLFEEKMKDTRPNIEASILIKLNPLSLVAAMMEHCTNTFSLNDMVRSDVVMIAGGDFQFPAVTSALNYLLLSTWKQKVVGQEEAFDRRHYTVVDEFTSLNMRNPATEILDLYERGRSRGARQITAFHSPLQLQEIYGPEKAGLLLGLHQNKLLFKMNDVEGSEWTSKILPQVFGYEYVHNYSVGGSVTQGPGGPSGSSSSNSGASETFANYPYVTADQIRSLRLASLKRGIEGYGILQSDRGVDRWKFDIPGEWVRANMVHQDPRIATYQSSRRSGNQQKLKDLTEEEVKRIGLPFFPLHTEEGESE